MPVQFHNYPDMFQRLFDGQHNTANFQFSIVPVIDEIFPNSANDFDGYLITGSAYGVYDDVPFIPKLMGFIRDIFAAGKPLVGICFGHQIIAHALGGSAAKFIGGWGIGTVKLNIVGKADWIPSNFVNLSLIHVHQDQVESLPKNAVRLATSNFCKNAAFTIGKQVFAMQGHPEFTADYTNALISIRESRIGKNRVAAARQSLQIPHDGLLVGGWILDFFETHEAAA